MAIFLIKFALLGLLTQIIVTEAIVNSKIDRIIDLSTQLVKITEKINVEQVSEPYIITLDPNHRRKLAYIDVKIDGKPLKVEEKSSSSFVVDLKGQDLTKQPLVVTTIYTRILKPYPAEITQSERQLVLYHGHQTTLSPYLTKTITTRIKLPQSSRLESFTQASKMTTGTNKLTYGPFKDVQPNVAESLTIHYENNSPFVAVTELSRHVEVSSWANNINIINEIKVAHIGAKLKGPFSRFEYQRDHSNGISSVRGFNVELPKLSSDIYFRDGIGNISTSNVRSTITKTMISIRPRFPLFGGWITDFVLGYSVPMSQFMERPSSSGQVQFYIPFFDGFYESLIIDDATVRIYLPAGSSNIAIENLIGAERLSDEVSYKYLDIIGRPVIVLKMSNIVTEHLFDKPIVVRYNYSKMYMLQEPFLVASAALLAFISAAIYSRMPAHCNTKALKID